MNESKRRKQVDGKWPCGKCKEYKKPEDFDKDSRSWNELENICKDCRSHKRKTCEEKENIWEFCLKKRYGMTRQEYADILAEQDGLCSICKQPEQNRRFSVDHCHDTGKIRGLLCSKCNTALGLFNDNIDSLVNAIDYLRKYII